MTQYATFRLDERLFGLDILVVREINRILDITSVPKAKPHIRGLINLRGQIFTILDVGVKLGLPPRTVSAETHNIILKTESELAAARDKDVHTTNDQVGFLVDAIGDVVEAEENQIEPPSANVNVAEGRFLSGVIKTEAGLLVLLNLQDLLQEH
jgi:purine-binding chemotaxis protein CheW